jgi:hypothetical protein
MSSHWDWEERVLLDHEEKKPFAPENGQSLKYKSGDRVIYTNEFGVEFASRVLDFYTEKTDALYCLGRRYLLDKDSWWFPVAESSLRPDTGYIFDQTFRPTNEEGFFRITAKELHLESNPNASEAGHQACFGVKVWRTYRERPTIGWHAWNHEYDKMLSSRDRAELTNEITRMIAEFNLEPVIAST